MKRIHSNNSENLRKYDETDWTSDSFVLCLKPNINTCDKIPNLNLLLTKVSSNPSRASKRLVDVEKYKSLIETKDQIGKIEEGEFRRWIRWSRLLNPYEKIGSFSCLSSEDTISRAFYKLYEILIYFKFYLPQPTTSLHLCEAPGGFINAAKYIYPEIDWYGHTLYDEDGLEISSSLKNDDRWLLYKKKDKNGNYHTGDLYNIKTIYGLKKELLNKKIDLVTADGGFDVSSNPNCQEQMSLKLIFSECLAALHCQEINGTFICKIFDTVTRPTCQLIVLLMKYYKNVNLIKPRTSRYSNSEKYIVALGFEGIEPTELKILDNVLKKWNNGKYCRDFGFELDFIEDVMPKLMDYNNFLSVNQSWYIHQSICCYKYFKSDNFQISKFNPNNLEVLQNKRALEFCTAFGLKNNENKYRCMHTRVTKINHESLGNVLRCNKCLNLLVNCKQ